MISVGVINATLRAVNRCCYLNLFSLMGCACPEPIKRGSFLILAVAQGKDKEWLVVVRASKCFEQLGAQ
jgi:hypothetical protein